MLNNGANPNASLKDYMIKYNSTNNRSDSNNRKPAFSPNNKNRDQVQKISPLTSRNKNDNNPNNNQIHSQLSYCHPLCAIFKNLKNPNPTILEDLLRCQNIDIHFQHSCPEYLPYAKIPDLYYRKFDLLCRVTSTRSKEMTELVLRLKPPKRSKLAGMQIRVITIMIINHNNSNIHFKTSYPGCFAFHLLSCP